MKIPKSERKFWVERGFKDPLRAYWQHKRSAKTRGIEFLLTPMEWWDIWAPHYHNRGVKIGQKVMCRHKDEGPYATWNVRIDTTSNNVREAAHFYGARKIKEAWGDESAGMMWVHDRFEMVSSGNLGGEEEMLDTDDVLF